MIGEKPSFVLYLYKEHYWITLNKLIIGSSSYPEGLSEKLKAFHREQAIIPYANAVLATLDGIRQVDLDCSPVYTSIYSYEEKDFNEEIDRCMQVMGWRSPVRTLQYLIQDVENPYWRKKDE